MIPYIVINGRSSKTVNGLLVQSLPPITKPEIRTETEEIDGRDGDVITVLGYAAYDKTLSVALRGDFNIDDVISFFNTNGQIIFSNEPDKYYNFAIYEAIDFNKLVRYRTANVEIHVQPFKYSADERPINKTFTGVTKDLELRNNGNIYSKPKITITGNGNINIDLNTKRVLTAEIADKIIIDVASMNATDKNGDYMNRYVTGNYNDLQLKTGLNYINMTGDITSITVENYSRWI